MRFVETPVFTAAVTALLADEEYRQLQLALLMRPEQGVLLVYAKSEQDDLTPAQLRVLRRLVREEFG